MRSHVARIPGMMVRVRLTLLYHDTYLEYIHIHAHYQKHYAWVHWINITIFCIIFFHKRMVGSFGQRRTDMWRNCQKMGLVVYFTYSLSGYIFNNGKLSAGSASWTFSQQFLQKAWIYLSLAEDQTRTDILHKIYLATNSCAYSFQLEQAISLSVSLHHR